MAVYIQKGDRIDYKNETEAVIKLYPEISAKIKLNIVAKD